MAQQPATSTDNIASGCGSFTPEAEDAKAKIDALDTQIRKLKPVDDHWEANNALIELLRHPCLALLEVDDSLMRAEAAPALVDFWTERGKLHIENNLGLATRRSLLFLPPMRKVVAAETRANHPAGSLLCPLSDAECGTETAGWWNRAEAYFTLSANTSRPILDGSKPTSEQCARDALALPAAERFTHWERCIRGLHDWRFAMPLGRIRAPTSGWLLVRGVRGNYTTCNEVRLYSLSSGAAYIGQDCNFLRLLEMGVAPEDFGPRFLRGSQSLENTRETTWMLLLLGEAVSDYPTYHRHQLPPGIDPLRDRSAPPGKPVCNKTNAICGVYGSSSTTTLAWEVLDSAGTAVASGSLRWPHGDSGGPAAHAGELLSIAEAGFIEGCPNEKLPENIRLEKVQLAASPSSGSSLEPDKTQLALMAELQKLVHAGC